MLVDLPGVQRPRDALTERMQRRVERELGECDAALFVLNGAERIGGGDRFIASALGSSPVPVVAAVNKVDLLDTRRPRRSARLPARRTWSGRESTCARSSRSRPDRRGRSRPLVRVARLDAARGAAALPRRRAHRPAARDGARRAGPRAGAGPHARGGAALDRGPGAGDRAERRPDPRQGGDLGRDRVAEGNPDRQARQHDPRDRHRQRARRWSDCWAGACSST